MAAAGLVRLTGQTRCGDRRRCLKDWEGNAGRVNGAAEHREVRTVFRRGMIATVALPHTVQGLRRWAEHLGRDGEDEAKYKFSSMNMERDL